MMIPIGMGAYSPPPPDIQAVLQNAAASSGVPLNILQSVAYSESRYKPTAVSPAGAQGLLQLMPATGASLGVTNPFDPQQNANAGASYLASLYRQYGNWNDALIAYNEGPGNFAKSGAFASSQQYADTILLNAGLSDTLQAMALPPVDTSSPDSTDSTDQASASSGLSPTVLLVGGAAAILGLLIFTRQ